MFFKFASNILQDLSNECRLKSFATLNAEDAKMYEDISKRLDALVENIEVDGAKDTRSKFRK